MQIMIVRARKAGSSQALPRYIVGFSLFIDNSFHLRMLLGRVEAQTATATLCDHSSSPLMTLATICNTRSQYLGASLAADPILRAPTGALDDILF